MSYQFDIIDIIIVQSVARRWKTRRNLAAVRLQCFARTISARTRYRENLAMRTLVTRHSAATRIQARWRSYTAQMQLLYFIAAVRIQARWRSHVAQEDYLLERSAMKIQSTWRSYTAQVHMLVSIVNVIVIQVSMGMSCGYHHQYTSHFFLSLFHIHIPPTAESLATPCCYETLQATFEQNQTGKGAQAGKCSHYNPKCMARLCCVFYIPYQEVREQSSHNYSSELAWILASYKLLYSPQRGKIVVCFTNFHNNGLFLNCAFPPWLFSGYQDPSTRQGSPRAILAGLPE